MAGDVVFEAGTAFGDAAGLAHRVNQGLGLGRQHGARVEEAVVQGGEIDAEQGVEGVGVEHGDEGVDLADVLRDHRCALAATDRARRQ